MYIEDNSSSLSNMWGGGGSGLMVVASFAVVTWCIENNVTREFQFFFVDDDE